MSTSRSISKAEQLKSTSMSADQETVSMDRLDETVRYHSNTMCVTFIYHLLGLWIYSRQDMICIWSSSWRHLNRHLYFFRGWGFGYIIVMRLRGGIAAICLTALFLDLDVGQLLLIHVSEFVLYVLAIWLVSCIVNITFVRCLHVSLI